MFEEGRKSSESRKREFGGIFEPQTRRNPSLLGVGHVSNTYVAEQHPAFSLLTRLNVRSSYLESLT